jgi:carbohydrate-selective porin OprB
MAADAEQTTGSEPQDSNIPAESTSRLHRWLRPGSWVRGLIFWGGATYINDSWAAHNGLPDNPSGTTCALIPLEVDWTPSS